MPPELRSRIPAPVPSPGSQHFFIRIKFGIRILKFLQKDDVDTFHFRFGIRKPSESIDTIEHLYTQTPLIHYAAAREYYRLQPL